MTSSKHLSVLYRESIDALAIKPDGLYVDATFGRGGHTRGILAELGPQGRLIAFDRDPAAIKAAEALADDPRFKIYHKPFSRMGEVLSNAGLAGSIDGILMDLGVSSPQLDEAERGFSFMRKGPLDMRMDPTRGQSAAEYLQYADLEDMVRVIKEYGEERFGRRIATAIVETREHTPITDTAQLAAIIDQAVPVKDPHKHPATRTFQAIRIHVNGELDEIRQALDASLGLLKPQGRLAVISFHSLEDRIVKRFMREQSRGKKVPARMPITSDEIDATKRINTLGKAIKPSKEEIAQNPRARSSVLRVAEKR